MHKKVLFVALIWIVVAATIFVLYLLREVTLVKAFITWALSVWPILAILGGAAVALSGWIIKHDFGHSKRKIHTSIQGTVISKTGRVLPDIIVRPTNEPPRYYLEVLNIGSTGKFEAQYKILEGINHLTQKRSHYVAGWEYEEGKYATILSGQAGRIKIAELISGRHNRLQLFKCEPNDSDNYVSSYEFGESTKSPSQTPDDHKIGYKDVKTRFVLADSKPEFVLEVTINATQGLKDGLFVKQYRLTPDKLEEITNLLPAIIQNKEHLIMPMSIPIKYRDREYGKAIISGKIIGHGFQGKLYAEIKVAPPKDMTISVLIGGQETPPLVFVAKGTTGEYEDTTNLMSAPVERDRISIRIKVNVDNKEVLSPEEVIRFFI